MTTKPRGGARQGAGAPRLVADQVTESVQVRLDPARRAKAMAIGGGHIVMRQVTQAVRISAAEWDKRPKGKFGAELPSTGPWVIEKIGVSEWFE